MVNVYNNANKIFNLRKGQPIGLITWGLGGIGGASISTLAKDLRKRFTEPGEAWRLGEDYTIAHVADRVRSFFYEHYKWPPTMPKQRPSRSTETVRVKTPPRQAARTLALPKKTRCQAWCDASPISDSSSRDTPQDNLSRRLYEINMNPDGCDPPKQFAPDREATVVWAGQPEAIHRLVNGFSGLPEKQVPDALDLLKKRLGAPIVIEAMPFQDAIDLADFLVELTIKWTRFMPGSPVVGGPIESAAISSTKDSNGSSASTTSTLD